MYDLVFVHLHKLNKFSQNLFSQTKIVMLDKTKYMLFHIITSKISQCAHVFRIKTTVW